MNQAVNATPASHVAPSAAATAAPHGLRRIVIAIAVLIGGTWLISRQKLYTPGDDIGYNLGLAGALMMLALLLYPLRKHVRFMQNWAPLRYWFRLHMLFGIGGPLLILLHSTFHVGSLNAAVALFSMLVVAGSGVIGRFIYTKIHHGLYGRRASLQERQGQLGLYNSDMQSKFHFAPKVEERLHRFEAGALKSGRGALGNAWQFMTLALRARWTYWLASRDLKRILAGVAQLREWERGKLQGRVQHGRDLIRAYLATVQDVAQFNVYERLFSLWHVLHVPFVYMLVFSAIFHVIAVHMY